MARNGDEQKRDAPRRQVGAAAPGERSRRLQRNLLILSCSKRKNRSRGRMTALDRYDGPVFRMVRKAIASNGRRQHLQVLILSAKYGFISSRSRICAYEKRMRPDPTVRQLSVYARQLGRLTRGRFYREVFINLGADYLGALPKLDDILEGRPRIRYARGRIGERLHQVSKWLSSVAQDSG